MVLPGERKLGVLVPKPPVKRSLVLPDSPRMAPSRKPCENIELCHKLCQNHKKVKAAMKPPPPLK